MSKILFVEDEPDIVYLVKKTLENEGYEVAVALTGDEGLKKLRAERPDLVLLDIMMPDIDGWEVCKRIKENGKTKDIPVVMFTVRSSEGSKLKSFRYAHADAHINKPYSKEELLSTIKGLLE